MKSKTSGPGWVPTVAALIGLGLTLSASYWQFGRAASKAELRQQYQARQAMAGNLCRCGAYDHYLNGVMRAAELLS